MFNLRKSIRRFLVGIPKERAGVSNNYSGLPKWEKSKFPASSETAPKIIIDLKK